VRVTRRFGLRPLAYATLTILLAMRCVAFAQDVTESSLKAAFIYNFVRFTEWPDAFPAVDPFVMCVLGDVAVGDALERTVRGRDVAVIAGLRDAPVLTISDIAGFTDVGGIVQFFFENGQLRFNIRLESAKRARLQISSRLLQLSQRYE
jgi:hypothetical protein